MKLSGAAGCMLLLAVVMIHPLYGNEWVFTGTVYGRNRGSVNALIRNGDTILSAGNDGFLEIWDTRRNAAVDRFQISPYNIIAIAGRQGKDELCLIENNEMGLYRIAAWNYRERRNIFTVPLRNPATHISYSMGGSFIIAAGIGRSGVMFMDAATGDALRAPQYLTGNVALAVTGRTERSLMVYCTSGDLSYWDLESGNETAHFDVPVNLRSPVLFSNNRYLAGVNADGLTMVHASSGDILAEDSSIGRDSLLCVSGNDILCAVQNGSAAELYRYSVDRQGEANRVLIGQFSVPAELRRVTAVSSAASGGSGAASESIVLGTSGGTLLLVTANGQVRPLATADQLRITEAAISGSSIAFLADNGTMGFIPLNYSQFSNGRQISIRENEEAYNRIIAFAADNGETGRFVFWQDRNSRTRPAILSSGTGDEKKVLDNFAFRSPIFHADSFGGKILFLDSSGNLSVISPDAQGETRPFTFSSVGIMNAVFADRSQLLLARSAVSDNAPFMMVNINTGETVRLPYPAQVGLMVRRGASGNIYAAVISSHDASGVGTSIVHFNPADSANSVKLADFRGEHTRFSFTESSGSIAATIGGEGASIYSTDNVQKLARTAGFPLQLLDGGNWLVSIDSSGCISWHETRSGNLLAVFRLHPNEWTLQTERGIIRGRI